MAEEQYHSRGGREYVQRVLREGSSWEREISAILFGENVLTQLGGERFEQRRLIDRRLIFVDGANI